MAHFESDMGIVANDWDTYYDEMINSMDYDDYAEILSARIDYDTLLNWALHQECFWDDFENEINLANDTFIDEHTEVCEFDEPEQGED